MNCGGVEGFISLKNRGWFGLKYDGGYEIGANWSECRPDPVECSFLGRREDTEGSRILECSFLSDASTSVGRGTDGLESSSKGLFGNMDAPVLRNFHSGVDGIYLPETEEGVRYTPKDWIVRLLMNGCRMVVLGFVEGGRASRCKFSGANACGFV
jgi:hypothetical protein